MINKGLVLSKNDPMVLWYNKPANEWVEALPIGNGKLGAMVFGGIEKERIQFNEDTIWDGGPHDYSHEGAVDYLSEIRKMLFDGKQSEAEELAMDKFMSVPLRQKAYQPFGDLFINFHGHSQPEQYRRELDLDSAIAKVYYTVDNITFQRETFVSFPDQVIISNMTADKPEKINFVAQLESPHPNSKTQLVTKEQIALKGFVKDGAIKFEARLLVLSDGDVEASKGCIEVKNANKATLILTGATNYVNYKDISATPSKRCENILNSVKDKSYDEIREAHIADHQELFSRVSLDLGTTEKIELPTDERIKTFTGTNDPHLVALYFQYGRYLMITSSRPGSQPANLQGIWNESMNPPWDSKWTVNINTEMNYWPTEPCNLAECHEPLFDMLEEVMISGRKVAKTHYNCRGWVLHHNTDLWRGAAPINHSNHGIWVTGGAWLCQHLWWHYQFNKDDKFLAEKAYPIMKDAALFFVDFLIEDPRNEGWLISTPSNSPEQGGLVAGPTMDHQIIRNLFDSVIEASKILNIDKEFREQLIKMRGKIAPNQVGQYGQLQEWLEDKDDPKNNHRHLSHLWGLHPGNEISLRLTPELTKAAKTSLEFRGDGGTGWSKAWKVNLWARLEDGVRANKMLTGLISNSTLPNMFDTHPPFQIDGNFGGCSGIAEMLMQSHTGEINLLAALPDVWSDGSVTGLCARGGFQVNISWKDGKLAEAVIYSKLGGLCNIRYKQNLVTLETEPETSYRLNEDLEIV